MRIKRSARYRPQTYRCVTTSIFKLITIFLKRSSDWSYCRKYQKPDGWLCVAQHGAPQRKIDKFDEKPGKRFFSRWTSP